MTRARCMACGAPAAPDAWRCSCGGLLDLPDMMLLPFSPAMRDAVPVPDPMVGLWRYASWLPVPMADGLTMGEGQTPLIPAGPKLPGLQMKLEFLAPTASFKDRGAVVLLASALERGAERVIADSSGNAGSAIAAYAARAGLPCTVFVPQRTSSAKQAQIEAYGAALKRVAGDRSATADRALAEVERTGAMYASHVYDPHFIQGTKTFAFEVWEQLSGVCDAILVPVGNGTLLLGAARGFRELHAAGMIARVPALIGLQSERCPPLALAWENGQDEPAEVPGEPTLAEGIAIPRPARGAQILAAVRESGGCVVSVPEAAIVPAQRELARRGLFVEPTAALVWAAALLARGRLDVPVRGQSWQAALELAAGTVVVPLCGSGLKTG